MNNNKVTIQMVLTHPYVYQHFAYEQGYCCNVYDGIIEGGATKSVYESIDMNDWNNQVALSYKREAEKRNRRL